MLTPEKMNRLQAVKNGRSMVGVVAKSTASCGKLNLLMANTSTPKITVLFCL